MEPTALDAVTLEKLISAAVAAPSIHNTQPWRFRLDTDTVALEVRAAAERTLRQADPLGRALHVSAGAALFNLRIAVAHFGWEPVVRLLPDPAEPNLLASVRLDPPSEASTGDIVRLYDVIWRRHTSRLPFSDHPIPEQLRVRMAEAAHTEGACLRMPEPEDAERLLDLTAEAERRNATDPYRRTESRDWVRDEEPIGVPRSALGPQDAGGSLPVRDFGAILPTDHVPPADFEHAVNIAVLSTVRDEPADWLRAGQALEHVLLLATAWNVRASFLHQALEWHDLRWALRDVHSGPHYVQMLVRLGYGPEGPATPRQAAQEFLE